MKKTTTALATIALLFGLLPAGAALADDPVDIWFPVDPDYHYSDTWGEARSGGRSHEGTDIMSEQMRPVRSANAGVIKKAKGEDCREGDHCTSFYLLVNGDDGHSYFYVHLNDDTPNRPNGCDGRGGAENAFSPRLVNELDDRGTLTGVRVERGEHIAYVGSSGNAGCGVDHLHFEIWHGHEWGSPKINPYRSVRAAEDAGRVGDPEGDGSNSDGSNSDGSKSEGSKGSSGTSPSDPQPSNESEGDNPPSGSGPPQPGPHGRLAGNDRIQTAVALSRHSFTSTSTVVIAPGDYHQEALVAAPLAAIHDAPVLLAWAQQASSRDALPDEVADEIRHLGAANAILVGHPDRLSMAVTNQLVTKAGLNPANIRRISGSSPYEVAARVAREVIEASDAPVSPLLALGEHDVDSRSWPDALGASVVAARQGDPVLLTRPGDLPGPVRDVLAGDGVGDVRVVGGPGAVDPSVEDEVRALGIDTRRLAGSTRFGTSVALANDLLAAGDGSAQSVYLATGHNFPDAIAAGPAVAQRGSVLVMVDGRRTDQADEVWGWLRDNADDIDRSIAVGGRGVMSQDVLHKAASYADWPRSE